MKSKIVYFLISAFIVFWVAFIGWGMFKTATKLSQGKKITAQARSPQKTESAKKEEPAKQPRTKEGATAQPASAQPEVRPILVRTAKTKVADFEDVLPVMGTVKGKTEVQLKFETNGVIKTIKFHEGEKIKKDDLIACIDPKDAQLRVDYAQSRYNAAEAAYRATAKKLEVHQSLYDAGAIIKSKLEEIQLEVESAKAQVETTKSEMQLAENELQKACIHATKDGIMGPREAEEGEFVTPQDKIGSLLETNEVYIEVGIVERDIDKVKLGQNAKVYIDAHPNIVFEGKVDKIFPVVEGKSRTLTAKIKVDNPQGYLMPGMFSRAEILVVELKGALMIPSVAMIPAGQGVTLIPVVPLQS
ncbi:MAG TPA: efflux RND transporter periplasmic adaptor subunit, partial [Patescibacteria group bacterium]|nr:efflux RND transporter periplasmic adaptor subunit [Patescibacteria group bacterium]